MKVALVTGASRGLGAAIAVGLAEAGWGVAVNYARDRSGAERVAAGIRAEGGHAVAVGFDVTKPKEVVRGLAEIATLLGPTDLVVNNATGLQEGHPIMEQTWDHYEAHLEIFLKAPLLIIQGLLPEWRQRKSGRVINIGSEVTEIGPSREAHYVSAKAAMIGLTRSWASELGPEGITVNLVSPGWVPVERHEGTSVDTYREHLLTVPLGRMGVPRDVAGTVVFIASSAADYITGQNFVVNGGRTFSS